MSVGAKTKYEQAAALVHRSTVRGATALPIAGWSSTTLAGGDSQHQGGRCQRSDVGTDPFEASDTCSNALRQWGRCVELP